MYENYKEWHSHKSLNLTTLRTQMQLWDKRFLTNTCWLLPVRLAFCFGATGSRGMNKIWFLPSKNFYFDIRSWSNWVQTVLLSWWFLWVILWSVTVSHKLSGRQSQKCGFLGKILDRELWSRVVCQNLLPNSIGLGKSWKQDLFWQ